MPKVTTVYLNGDKLRDLMERAGLTTADVGAQVHASAATVYNATRGMVTGRRTAAKIASVLKTSLENLLADPPEAAAVRAAGAA